MAHREIGLELVEGIADKLKDKATVTSRPRLQGRMVSMQLSPV